MAVLLEKVSRFFAHFLLMLVSFVLAGSYPVTAFGQACAGSGGQPSLRSDSLPWTGDDLDLVLEGLPPSRLAVPFGLLGVSDEVIGNGTLPVDLGAIGMTGCMLWVSTEFDFTLENRFGTARWTFSIPNDVGLVGQRFFVQALVLDSPANPFGAIVTNAAAATIGVR